jgi:phage-related tail protein
MKAEEYVKKLEEMKKKIYKNFSEFVSDLNYTKMSIKEILPVNNFEKEFLTGWFLVKLEIENKKYIAKLSYQDITPFH